MGAIPHHFFPPDVCCLKDICIGCCTKTLGKCPFCKEDTRKYSLSNTLLLHLRNIEENSSDDNERIIARNMLASSYDIGRWGNPQDSKLAHEMWTQSLDIGPSKDAHYNLSQSYGKYHKKRGVQKDEKKEIYHMEEAAMLGDAAARCQLGKYEVERGNYDRAKRHLILSAAAGCESCMEKLRLGNKQGVVSNKEYKKTLCKHIESLKLTRSAERDAGFRQFQSRLKLGPKGKARVF